MESTKQVLLATLQTSLLLADHGRTRAPWRALGLEQPVQLDPTPVRLPTAAWLPTDDAVEDPLR